MFCTQCGSTRQACRCSQPCLPPARSGRRLSFSLGFIGLGLVALVLVSEFAPPRHEYFRDEHNGVPEDGTSTHHALATEPAPDGNPAVVAQQAIRGNFDRSDCPFVTDAERRGDGSIRATCSNGETYRIFTFRAEILAMRCSAAQRLGVAGC